MKNKKREHLISSFKHDKDKIHPIIKQIDHFKIPRTPDSVIIISFNFYKTHNLMKYNTVSNLNSHFVELLGIPAFKMIGSPYYRNDKTYYSNNKRNYYLKYLDTKTNIILKSLSNKYSHKKLKKIINSISFRERIDSLYVSPLFRTKFILDDEHFSPNNVKDYFINVPVIRTNKVLVRYIMYLLGITDVEILLEFLNKKYDKTNYKIFFKNCNIRNNTVQYHIRYIVTKNKLVKKVIKIDILSSLLSFLRKEHNTFH